jgi:hypothetical protein
MPLDSYSLLSSMQFLRDAPAGEARIERLKYHLETGDYFLFLSTVLGFAQETLAECTCAANSELTPLEVNALENARKDLEYLQKNFGITSNSSD